MEWKQLHQHQEDLFLQLKKVEKLEAKEKLLNEQIDKLKREMEDQNSQFQKEKHNFEKLEDFSFVNMFRNWTGKTEILRKEKIDKVAALELKLKESQLMTDDLTKDLKETIEQLMSFDKQKLKNELFIIVAKKEIWLKENKPNDAIKLSQIENDELNCKKLIREIEEARSAGNKALNALYQALDSIDSARSYSTWDTFLGGGMIATHLKHQKLDDSKSLLHKAQLALQRFKNELLDVQEMDTRTLMVDTDGFVKFADYFFDDIFSAWSIHSKIATSKEQTSKVISDVQNTLIKLKNKEERVKVTLENCLFEKNKLLEINEDSLFL